jgi:flagellar basal-body rod protein FlgC
MFNGMDISVSGMEASNTWMEVVANNLANSRTVRTPQGGAYQRQAVVFEQVFDQEGRRRGVQVAGVLPESRSPEMRHEPGHPLADANGDVAYPDINPAQEMGEMLAASRTYEANAAALSNMRQMVQKALEI